MTTALARGSIVRGILVLLLLAAARPLSGQTTADVGGYISRHGLGLHVAGSVKRISVFGRAESFNSSVHTLGVRLKVLAPADGAFVASAFGGRGSCASITLGERGTGCDDRWHSLVGAGAGVEVRSGTRGVVFADVLWYHILDGSTDIAPWSFAAGYIFRISLDD